MLDVREGYYGEIALEYATKADDRREAAIVAKMTGLAQVYATLELAVQTHRLRS